MALFKILQGESSRISRDVTPFHNGWCYYTSDDGKFYIDSEDDGVQNRRCINEAIAAKVIKSTLSASAWTGNQQTLTLDGITPSQNGIAGIDVGISEDQLTAAANSKLYVSGQGNNSLTISALGTIPNCDIPIVILLFSAILSCDVEAPDSIASTSYVDSVVGNIEAALSEV